MIGKLFVPLAIGGGLMFLLASSAGAKSGPPKTPFDSLPATLKQLASQAQATNNPGLLEQAAATLEQQGFGESAAVLRQQAAALRQASQPSSPGFAPPLAPAVSAPAVLSADLQKMVADAIQSGAPPVLTSTAFVVEKAGFPELANELRERAKQAATGIAPPPVQDHPNAALDPSMPADLALEVARQLQLQGDPNVLESLATELRKRGFSATADQVEAKAQQIRAMLDAARTMSDINTEFKSPGIAQQPPGTSQAPPPSASFPAAPPPSPLPSGPAPMQLPPLVVTATPPGPLQVPSTPQPQAPAPEKSKAQIMAETVASNLNDLIDRYGSVPGARFKEDKGLVQTFQTQEGLTADGAYGPTTATHVARYVSDVPPPFYWKKGAGQKDLSKYRSDLQTLALDAEQTGNTDRAERLRQSALKASLA